MSEQIAEVRNQLDEAVKRLEVSIQGGKNEVMERAKQMLEEMQIQFMDQSGTVRTPSNISIAKLEDTDAHKRSMQNVQDLESRLLQRLGDLENNQANLKDQLRNDRPPAMTAQLQHAVNAQAYEMAGGQQLPQIPQQPPMP